MNRILPLAFLVAAISLGCGDSTATPSASKKEGGVGEHLKSAGEKIKEEAEDVGKKIKEESKVVGEKIQEEGKIVGGKIKEGAAAAEEKIKEESKIVGEKAKQLKEKVLPGKKDDDSKK
jgi:gas vesicle protein